MTEAEQEEFRQGMETFLTHSLISMTLSNPRASEIKKIRIRPLTIKGVLFFQAAMYEEKKVFHKNFSAKTLLLQLMEWLGTFRQLEADNEKEHLTVLVSKKGKIKLIKKPQKQKLKQQELSHNRTKHYLLEEGVPIPFLVDLGVMTKEGRIVSKKYDKFRQINRFLEFIQDILPILPKDREIHMIDFGCGKSYLTFAMYYYLKEKLGYEVMITGLDLKTDVILHCSQLAERYGYTGCRFQVGDIEHYQREEPVDVVVTLHACDTATDFALEKAVRWNARAILSVPCCQHELNAQINQEILQPVLQYGIIKERMAALFTDGIRAELLKQCGYEVQILEFIDMEHTPKNLLIRAVKKSAPERNHSLDDLLRFLHVSPTLEKLLEPQPFNKE